jgi:lipopolysaccharide transport system ATP-binding protein
MSDLVIKAENISKLYRLGNVSAATFKADAYKLWAKVRGLEDPTLLLADINDRTQKGTSDYVWALKDIHFEVNRGDVLGIVGSNGAGKSTLLKILSKVTAPTSGSIKVKGRIASLLEVGTGFHPELTGNENIYLNGHILGMTKKEIDKKFDEIIDFAGVEKYLDTPVKRYSSGMYVRLAFAVAAHLEPEILILDEVLTVGDVEFQKKCLGKVKSVSQNEGRTILFVSHNLPAVKSLCNRTIIIEHGRTKFFGETTSALSYYLKGDSESQNKKTFGADFDRSEFTLHEIRLNNVGKNSDQPLSENLEIELITEITIKDVNPERYHIAYHLHSEMGESLFAFGSSSKVLPLKQKRNVLSCTFPKYFFQSGTYSLALFIIIDERKAIFIQKDVISFTIVDSARELGTYMGREPGFIRPTFTWNNHVL